MTTFYSKIKNIQSLMSVYLNYGLWNETMDLVKELIKNWSYTVDSTVANATKIVSMPFNLIDTLNKFSKAEQNKNLIESDLKKVIFTQFFKLINSY